MVVYDKGSLVEILQDRVAEVTFRKIEDGTIRIIRGTLNQELIPEEQRPGLSSDRRQYPGVVNIWDVDAQGWRAFRTDRILDVV